MAKQKEVNQDIKDCNKCKNKIVNQNTTYCKLKMFDENVFTKYAISNFVINCIWYK